MAAKLGRPRKTAQVARAQVMANLELFFERRLVAYTSNLTRIEEQANTRMRKHYTRMNEEMCEPDAGFGSQPLVLVNNR